MTKEAFPDTFSEVSHCFKLEETTEWGIPDLCVSGHGQEASVARTVRQELEAWWAETRSCKFVCPLWEGTEGRQRIQVFVAGFGSVQSLSRVRLFATP